MFRIQKLMLAEYRDIYEPVLVENPFTQVTEYGEGLRQYHIGSAIDNKRLSFIFQNVVCVCVYILQV